MMTNKNTFDAIIFDMDGVIIDSKELVEAFWYRKLDQYNISVPEGGDIEFRFHGRPARLTVNDLFAELPEETREEIIKECALYDQAAEKFNMIPGVEQFMKDCSESGIPMGLVTSALPGKVDRMLAGLHYPSPFDVTITADLVKKGKPDPECYIKAAGKLGMDPGRIIVFEDSINGVQAASGAGSTVIGVNEEHLAGALTEAGAAMVMTDFKQARIEGERSTVKIYLHNENAEIIYLVSK